ncbi:MAG: ABC transporter permease subunit [Verrucomicrobiota bacterium]
MRTLQPVLADLSHDVEEVAACLGASRWQTFRRVILPAVRPALITGMMLAFGRAVGEYGSVVFISSMIPFLHRDHAAAHRDQARRFDYVGAAGLGLAMLVMSFAIVGAGNALQHWTRPRGRVA